MNSEIHTEDGGLDRCLKQGSEAATFTVKDADKSEKINGRTNKSTLDVLEVEDDEQRLARLQSLLENIDSLPSSSASLPSTSFQFPLLPSSRPHFVPKSEIFSRIEAFLPQMAQSNAELMRRAQDDPTSVDIENVAMDQEAYIEMNLGLGVFEKKRRRKTDDGTISDLDSASDSHSDSNENDETHLSDCSASHSVSESDSRSDVDSSDSGNTSNATSSPSSEEASSSSSSSSAS